MDLALNNLKSWNTIKPKQPTNILTNQSERNNAITVQRQVSIKKDDWRE